MAKMPKIQQKLQKYDKIVEYDMEEVTQSEAPEAPFLDLGTF